MDKTAERIQRRRMYGLYLSRGCGDIKQLSQALLGMHCWFHRNVVFSALIRGAGLGGWKSALTKTWLYRGTLHGAVYEDLPLLLALHADDSFSWLLEEAELKDLSEKVIRLMADGVYSRAEMRRIFAPTLDERVIDRVFSPWGGIFVYLARKGRVAFRDMTSRAFDLIDAEPVQKMDQVLPTLMRRYFSAYGPATLEDAAWFFGLGKADRHKLSALKPEGLSQLQYGGSTYYFTGDEQQLNDIPELTLLSGFDPLIVSYTERGAVLPPEYKRAVILKSGICLPSIAVNGRVAGLWNIRKGGPEVTFFTSQPKRIKEEALNMAGKIWWQASGAL